MLLFALAVLVGLALLLWSATRFVEGATALSVSWLVATQRAAGG